MTDVIDPSAASLFQSLFYRNNRFNKTNTWRAAKLRSVSILILQEQPLQPNKTPDEIVADVKFQSLFYRNNRFNSFSIFFICSCICSFNPYFTGTTASTLISSGSASCAKCCFNPYFTGTTASTNRVQIINDIRCLFQSLFYRNNRFNRAKTLRYTHADGGFNPYFTGTTASTDESMLGQLGGGCFNPYFTGTTASTYGYVNTKAGIQYVSILILQEQPLQPSRPSSHPF